MAQAPKYKVYDRFGGYVAAVKEIEAGAALMALYGDGSTIRLGHTKRNTLWTEGEDGQACESWDAVAKLAFERHRAISLA